MGSQGENLDALANAAYSAAFYSTEPRHVRDLAAVVERMEARGQRIHPHDVRLYESYLGAWMLPEARGFAQTHPLVAKEPVPAVRDGERRDRGRPSKYVVAPDRSELERMPVELTAGVQIVVIAHPLCHFTQDAARDLEADPVLRDVLAAHSQWLAPTGPVDLDAFRQWNLTHPTLQTALISPVAEWPMIDDWRTPTFYVLRDGVVRERVTGWRHGEQRAALVAALTRAGLLSSTTPRR